MMNLKDIQLETDLDFTNMPTLNLTTLISVVPGFKSGRREFNTRHDIPANTIYCTSAGKFCYTYWKELT